MTDNPRQPDPRRRDELVDELLDRRHDDPEARAVFERLRADLDACRDLASLQRTIDALRRTPRAPDLTEDILHHVERRRRFLPTRLRRMVTVGRVAVAAGVVFAIGVAALTRHHAPDFAFTPEPTPVSNVVASSKDEAASVARNIASTAGTLRDDLTAPVVEVVATARTIDRATAERRARSVSLALDPQHERMVLQWTTESPIVGGSGSSDLMREQALAVSGLHDAPRTVVPEHGRAVIGPFHAGLFGMWFDSMPTPSLPDRFERAAREPR